MRRIETFAYGWCALAVSIVGSVLGSASIGCAGAAAGAVDGGPDAADAAHGRDGDPGDGTLRYAPEIYGADRSLSPITPYVADRLRAIAAAGAGLKDNVFAKVGDGASVSSYFAHCFAGTDIDFGDDSQTLAQLEPAIELFRDGNAAGATPFERPSLAARLGMTTAALLDGAPSRLEQEYAAISPRFAVVLVGTDELEGGDFDAYGSNLLTLVDRSIAMGTIPILSSLLPRGDSAELDALVPRYNQVVRGVAQARQVLFADLHRELAGLPARGLGPGGVLPSVYRQDTIARPCVFHAAGLQHGYNARNLLTMTALYRALDVVLQGGAAPDAPVRTWTGGGTAEDPFVIDTLPFTHAADTSVSGSRTVDIYDGCQAAQDEAGPELVYRLDVDEPVRIRAMVVDRGSADIDVHLLAGGTGGDACMQRAHRELVASLAPGTYFFNLDTFVNSAGMELAGEYLFVVLQEP